MYREYVRVAALRLPLSNNRSRDAARRRRPATSRWSSPPVALVEPDPGHPARSSRWSRLPAGRATSRPRCVEPVETPRRRWSSAVETPRLAGRARCDDLRWSSHAGRDRSPVELVEATTQRSYPQGRRLVVAATHRQRSTVAPMPYVYILECSDASYYVGSTWDLERRVGEHNLGLGAEYTRRRRPVCWSGQRGGPDRRGLPGGETDPGLGSGEARGADRRTVRRICRLWLGRRRPGARAVVSTARPTRATRPRTAWSRQARPTERSDRHDRGHRGLDKLDRRDRRGGCQTISGALTRASSASWSVSFCCDWRSASTRRR